MEPLQKSLFRQLQDEVARSGITARTTESRQWFMEKARDLRNINRRNLLTDLALEEKARPLPGRLYHYFYDPKHKDTLPYYDRFPLTLMVSPAENGFYGLNLHYLHPMTRAKLMDSLMDVATNRRYNYNTKLKINYEILSKAKEYKEFKPCFKHYLTKHLRSRVVLIPASEWDIALFLPTEQFKGSTKTKVWNESKRIYRS
jgi:hypothetical protein